MSNTPTIQIKAPDAKWNLNTAPEPVVLGNLIENLTFSKPALDQTKVESLLREYNDWLFSFVTYALQTSAQLELPNVNENVWRQCISSKDFVNKRNFLQDVTSQLHAVLTNAPQITPYFDNTGKGEKAVCIQLVAGIIMNEPRHGVSVYNLSFGSQLLGLEKQLDGPNKGGWKTCYEFTAEDFLF